jgi:AraC-like DNA-binding protein
MMQGLFDPDLLLQSYSVYAEWHNAGEGIFHTHKCHQLLYADNGVITVLTTQGRWVCSPERGVWIPGGTEHALYAPRRFRLCTLYADPNMPVPRKLGHCSVVAVTSLVREILHSVLTLSLSSDMTQPVLRALALVPELIQPLEQLSRGLPMPTDRRARQVANHWLAHPVELLTAEQLARQVGASVRTLERIFRAETGFGLLQWRTRLRLFLALERLGEGQSVIAAAHATGYKDASSFSRAFRRLHGFPPAHFSRLQAHTLHL